MKLVFLQKNNMRLFLLIILFPIFSHSQNEREIFTMFYNVENLFDTINNPNKEDDEFLPNGRKEWNTKKYYQKIHQLAKVFENINQGNKLNLIALSEVENQYVIQDLLKTDFLKNNKYTIIHKNSPDNRGIDCAILIDETFELLEEDFISIKIPNGRPTRDIVYAKLGLGGEIIHVFINHWPSRWGGQEKTEPRRLLAAKTLRNYIEKNIPQKENILIMGDFNDYPSNKSVQDILVQKDFINLMSTKKLKDLGSYNYKGEWNFIDHIITSRNFLNVRNNLRITDYNVFKEDWLLYYNEGDGQYYPNRTFGKSWYGGFSDHLAIFCVFKQTQLN